MTYTLKYRSSPVDTLYPGIDIFTAQIKTASNDKKQSSGGMISQMVSPKFHSQKMAAKVRDTIEQCRLVNAEVVICYYST